MWKKITEFCNHERYQVISVALCLVIIVTGLCCESQTTSIIDPTKKITRAQLNAELEKMAIDLDQRYAELDKQDELKAVLYEHLMLWTTTGTFNPTALVPLLASLLGVGAITDNVRKRITIKKMNNAGPSNTT